MAECVFRGAPFGEDSFICQIHQKCKLSDGNRRIASCDKCRDSLQINSKDFATRWQDPLHVVDRTKTKTTSLRNLLAGGSAFLVCGGPSASELVMEKLSARGLWSLAVNNIAGHSRWRPQAFTCSDPPMKFSHSIWFDPGIMKLIPVPKLDGRRRGRIREKHQGAFKKSERTTLVSPNVWGYRRESWLEPNDHFFLSDGACWGNQDAGVKRTGQRKTVCTMMLGLRLLYYLGARTIYLVGVDFRMSPEYGYAFGQARDEGASRSNNEHFLIVNEWLCEMVGNGTFKRFGLGCFNCFEYSGLRAFPYVPIDQAIQRAKGDVEDDPDLSHWYEKEDCPKCSSWHVLWMGGGCKCLDCDLEWHPSKRAQVQKAK